MFKRSSLVVEQAELVELVAESNVCLNEKKASKLCWLINLFKRLVALDILHSLSYRICPLVWVFCLSAYAIPAIHRHIG
jgi:hypothetical protein